MIESKRINGVYLKADKENGVREIDYSDLTETDEICKPTEFLKFLKDMAEGESAITFIDGWNEEIYDQIARDYGIK
jgi:hypothetical protein